jgi:haloacid dehalogenase-like hydrolase
LSNTHNLELRERSSSPLAVLVDAVTLSHEIGAVKPDPAAYEPIVGRLGIAASDAAYVGDGSSNELVGARRAGFFSVVLVAAAPIRLSPGRVPVLRNQADFALSTLGELSDALRGLGTSKRGCDSQRRPVHEHFMHFGATEAAQSLATNFLRKIRALLILGLAGDLQWIGRNAQNCTMKSRQIVFRLVD